MDYYSKNEHRVWEIDFMRGVAIILMVFLHIIWAIDFFKLYSLNNTNSLAMVLIQRFTAGTFIFLVGVSLVLSYSRIKDTGINIYKKYFTRGVKIFCYGLLITIATFMLSGKFLITFGILHMIGVGIILATFLLKLKKTNLVLGVLIIVIGLFTSNINAGWLYWLGFQYPGFALDFFPIMPWFGLIPIGLFFGNTFYSSGKSLLKYKKIPLLGEAIAFLGRYSLLIYFLHIIVILTVVALLGKLSFG